MIKIKNSNKNTQKRTNFSMQSFSTNDHAHHEKFGYKYNNFFLFKKIIHRKTLSNKDVVCTSSSIDNVIVDELLKKNGKPKLKLGDKLMSATINLPDSNISFNYLSNFQSSIFNCVNYDSASRHFHSISAIYILSNKLFVNYLITSIPRCIYDTTYFMFTEITKEQFYSKQNFETSNIFAKYVCYVGLQDYCLNKDVKNLEKDIQEVNGCNLISVFYIQQKCPYVETFICFKKLVIFWPAFDPLYQKHKSLSKQSETFMNYLDFIYNGEPYNNLLDNLSFDKKQNSVNPMKKMKTTIKVWKYNYFNTYVTQGAYRINLKPYYSTCFKLTPSHEAFLKLSDFLLIEQNNKQNNKFESQKSYFSYLIKKHEL